MIPGSLFSRLSLVFVLVLLSLGIVTLSITHRSQQRYFDEFSQALSRPVAMYMAGATRLFVDGKPDRQALNALAEQVMMVNPSLEVFLLDSSGHVLASLTGADQLRFEAVDLAPVRQFLEPDARLPIYGDHPLQPRPRVFSAFPVTGDLAGNSGCVHCGYVYAILGGERHRSLWQSLSASYAWRNASAMIAGVVVLALVFGLALFFLMTRPLRVMSMTMNRWRLQDADSAQALALEPLQARTHAASELQLLESSCQAMTERLNQQYQVLADSDLRRRQFLTGISHDLRTPLTSLCGAVETLVLKRGRLDDEEQLQYLQLAQRQGLRLRRLISQVFELARLDTGEVVAHRECLPLADLAHDTVQDLYSQAREKGIELQVDLHGSDQSLFVNADMGMMQRVLENLIGNAIRHTPATGHVTLRLGRCSVRQIEIEVIDTGRGFPQVLENCAIADVGRFGNADDTAAGSHMDNGDALVLQGGGLGLGIVQRMLNLHDSQARIWSRPGQGTRVRFCLAAVSGES